MEEKFIKIIKNIAGILFTIIFVCIICFYELPYYIDTPGGLNNLNKRVKVENGYESKGSINLTYVSELPGTLPLLLVALFHPDWKIESKKDNIIGTLDYDKLLVREQILMKQSYTSAIKFAYEAANKEVEVEEEKCYVIYIFEVANTDLKVGDQIIEVDGKKINSCREIRDHATSKNKNDESKIIVKNNNKEYERNVKYVDFDGVIAIGIQLGTEYVLNTNPKYKLDFNENEFGPSGGLMIALAVYNSLVEEDITGGKVIAGTGTLDADGNVGEIGGIEYKLKGAVKKKADVFLVPSGDNYEEAKKIKEKKKYKIDIVEVKTFYDALDYLKSKM